MGSIILLSLKPVMYFILVSFAIPPFLMQTVID